jgi:hypothetical protein
VEQGRRHQRGEREYEEDRGRAHIKEGHEGEDDDRREQGDDNLRQVEAEKGIERFDALDQGEDGVAGAALVEVAGAEL